MLTFGEFKEGCQYCAGDYCNRDKQPCRYKTCALIKLAKKLYRKGKYIGGRR